MLVANGLSRPFRERVDDYGGSLVEEERGIWRVDKLAYRMYAIETGVVCERPGERPLALFSRRSPEDVMALARAAKGPERAVFYYIQSQLEDLKRRSEIMALEDHPFFQKTEEEMIDEILSKIPFERRLRGLPAEERVRGLPAEERVRGLPAEELAMILDEVLTPAQKRLLKERLH